MKDFLHSIASSVKRCRTYVLTIFISYCVSCSIGIIMSHNGNHFALDTRDRIVGQALKTDQASINYREGNRFTAAVIDFAENLFIGAVPQTLLGFGIVIPYFTTSIQGWLGGVVSVDSRHKSRFKNFKSTFYYFSVLFLQFVPYSLAIGAGVKCGVDLYRTNTPHGWLIQKYRFPKTSLVDLGLIYTLVVPLFFIASCFEFLSAWNI